MCTPKLLNMLMNSEDSRMVKIKQKTKVKQTEHTHPPLN